MLFRSLPVLTLQCALTIASASILSTSIAHAYDVCPDLFISEEFGIIESKAARGALTADLRKVIPAGEYDVIIDGEPVRRPFSISYSPDAVVQLKLDGGIFFENRHIPEVTKEDGSSSKNTIRVQVLHENRLMLTSIRHEATLTGTAHRDVSISATLGGDLSGETRKVLLYTKETITTTAANGDSPVTSTERHEIEITIPNPKISDLMKVQPAPALSHPPSQQQAF